jgi:hypothetical protein
MRFRGIYSELSSTHITKDPDTSMEPAVAAEKTLSPTRHFCGFIAVCRSTPGSAWRAGIAFLSVRWEPSSSIQP